MDIEACKRDIAIPEFLTRRGVALLEDRAGHWWGLTPFRRENTASFMAAVDRRGGHWYWRDWGEGQSGDILHLVQRLDLADSIGGALRYLNEVYAGGIPQDWRPADDTRASSLPPGGPLSDRLVVDRAGNVTNRVLIGYAAGRGIPADVLKRFAREVWWRDTVKNRSFFGLGLRNVAEGFEVRNGSWKGCIGHKDLAVFSIGTADTVDVAEGLFDGLTLAAEGEAQGRILMLNSAGLARRGVEWVREHAPGAQVRLHLDHDVMGRRATALFREAFPDACDRSHRFDFYDDLNAWWCDCGRLAAAGAAEAARAQPSA